MKLLDALEGKIKEAASAFDDRPNDEFERVLAKYGLGCPDTELGFIAGAEWMFRYLNKPKVGHEYWDSK